MAKWDSARRRGAFRKAPAGLLGMLALVALAEGAVRRHSVDFTNVCPDNWRYSEREARRRAEPGAVLCFGTSLLKYGVVSRQLERETGRPAFNLAVCSGHMPTSYFLLKHALGAGAKPAAVVVDCQDLPDLLGKPRPRAEAIEVNLRQWPELLTPRETAELAWAARDAVFPAEMALSWLLPSYKARYDIRKCVADVLRGEVGSSRTAVMSVRRNWQVNRGTMVMPVKPPPAAPDPPEPDGPPNAFQANRLTGAYARRFVALAASRGVPVFWVMPPCSPAQKWHRDRWGETATADRLAVRLRAEFPNLTVIDGRSPGYGPEAFQDRSHLNRRGALVFTADLGAAVARLLAGDRPADRWVRLPAYRDRPEAVAVEDLSESVKRHVDAVNWAAASKTLAR